MNNNPYSCFITVTEDRTIVIHLISSPLKVDSILQSLQSLAAVGVVGPYLVLLEIQRDFPVLA